MKWLLKQIQNVDLLLKYILAETGQWNMRLEIRNKYE